jgi:hypothetical protein
MKCLRCGTQNDYRDRQGGARGSCASCGKPFAFEPREDDPITDGAFNSAIAAVSDDGRLAWLDRHLYYEVARRVRRRRLFHRLTRRARVSLDHDRYSLLFARWVATYGEPPGLLKPNAFAVDIRRADRAEDAADYGFDRLLVCDSDDIVDVLLANSFHADNRCAVLSVTGYPSWAYELLMPRLRAAPPAIVAVVHDSDVEGCRLGARVKSGPHWFAGVKDLDVVDAGLRPADASRFRGVLLEGTPTDVLAASSVSVQEAQWLGKHRLELEAVRPRALMAVLATALNRDPEAAEYHETGDGTWWALGGWGDGGGGGGDDDVG